MTEKTQRFYTPTETVDAIRLAFVHYPRQLNLLKLIWPMVFGENAYLLTDNPQQGIWAKRPQRKKPYLADERTLKQQIIERLTEIPPPPGLLAKLCTHVFGVSAFNGEGPDESGREGVWIEIDMAGFVCSRCGHCCRTLDYRDGCTLDDYRQWQEEGREDILKWVGTVRQQGRVVACRIWMVPGTNRFADACPWLVEEKNSGRACCTIYDARPMICRHYPGSRKHARLTGCGGV